MAVADGMVVFAEWMTGYGMILIVDHGNGYMSLYANNDTLLRNPGTYVKRGELVAKVGRSGGQGCLLYILSCATMVSRSIL